MPIKKNTDLGRPPLSKDEGTITRSFRAPISLMEQAFEKQKELGFNSFGEYLRYLIQQDLFRKVDDDVVEMNGLKEENIDLRAKLKGRKKRSVKFPKVG